MVLCGSSFHARSSSRLKRHRHKGSCWRNPFLVFLLSFVTIGSLRFRVPQRSKKAAVSLVKRKHGEPFRSALKKQKNLIMNDTKRSSDVDTGDGVNVAGRNNVGPDMSAETPKNNVKYILVDELTSTESSFSYRKFKVVRGSHEASGENDVNEHGLTVKEWASIVADAREDDASITLLNNIIASSPYDAVFFETPATTASTYESQPFEFVLVDAPRLHAFAVAQSAMNSDNPFHTALSTASNATFFAAAFPNLGADALLIVPKAIRAGSGEEQQEGQYSHLASFSRNGSSQQIAALWNMVAQAYLDRILQQQPNPVWLSTSGLGVLWLHFRLDTVPKYYSYEPYKQLI